MKKTLTREKRLPKARQWIQQYTGEHIVKAYKKRFGVDQICAMTELKMLGVSLDDGYVKRATEAERIRIDQNRWKKEERREKEFQEKHADQDDQFFFIAGYTSGGTPYGVTGEEMGLEPWQELDAEKGDG